MFWAGVILVLPISFFSTASPGKILAWPTDGSHFLNLNIILEELAHKGHEVTVLVHSANMIMDTNKTSALQFEVFPVSFDKERNERLLEELLHVWIYEVPNMSHWEFFTGMNKAISDTGEVQRLVCDGIIKNKVLLNKLKEENFDILVADPMALCGDLIAEIIGVPFIYSLRFSMGNVIERHCGHIPTPYSYVPGTMTQFTDKMSFVERLKNAIFFLSQDALFYFALSPDWNQYYSEAIGKYHLCSNLTFVSETLGGLSFWLQKCGFATLCATIFAFCIFTSLSPVLKSRSGSG